ncbi:unnamed protein product [Prorocentrum cordatum]|uniref:FAD-binding domain-containing protein n=1 Tax=Prorocentrum cordatum TaxID=2364126 RepID=A0ABN9T247_9DINO|nr:unnamed protein product [Polarella glacialis]
MHAPMPRASRSGAPGRVRARGGGPEYLADKVFVTRLCSMWYFVQAALINPPASSIKPRCLDVRSAHARPGRTAALRPLRGAARHQAPARSGRAAMSRLCGASAATATPGAAYAAGPPPQQRAAAAAARAAGIAAAPAGAAAAAAEGGPSVAVVGAGPVGLLAAIALFRRGYRKVRVFDRLARPAPPDAASWGDAERSYNLGIGERGLKALQRFEVLDTVDRWSQTVLGRMDYKQDGSGPALTLQKKRMPSRILARDRLSSCIYEDLLRTCPGVQVEFSVECEDVAFHPGGATLKMQQCVPLKDGAPGGGRTPEDEECQVDGGPFSVDADVVIGADGVNSMVREAMERAGARTRKHAFRDRSPTVYKTLPVTMPAGSRLDLNYGTRLDGVGLEALPNVEGTLAGVVLFKPTDTRFTGMRTAGDARECLESLFPDWPLPQLSEAELEAFAQRRVRNLPQFSYCGPSLNLGGRAVLLGDRHPFGEAVFRPGRQLWLRGRVRPRRLHRGRGR